MHLSLFQSDPEINRSINQSINQSYRSVLFLTWPKQQTATSKITKGEQLKGKTGVGTKG